MWTVAVAVVVVLVIAGVRSQGQEETQGRDAIEEAIANVIAANSYHAMAELVLDLPSQRNPAQLIDVVMRAEGDIQETENDTLFGGNLFIEAKGRGLVLFTEGELRIMPASVAFKLNSLPALLNPEGTLTDKWTYVDTDTLRSTNTLEINQLLIDVGSSLQRRGPERIPGTEQQGIHYQGQLTQEQEDVLVAALRQPTSNSKAWNVVARLLRAFDARVVDVWIDEEENPQLRRVAVTFENPEVQNDDPEATLILAFSDFGKEVNIEAPEREITVSPEVFARLFGEGDVRVLEGE